MVKHHQKKYEKQSISNNKKKEKLIFSWVDMLFYKFLTLKTNRGRKVFFLFTVPGTKIVECNPGQCELVADGYITRPVTKQKEINADGQMFSSGQNPSLWNDDTFI